MDMEMSMSGFPVMGFPNKASAGNERKIVVPDDEDHAMGDGPRLSAVMTADRIQG
jgi:hypothetical protein